MSQFIKSLSSAVATRFLKRFEGAVTEATDLSLGGSGATITDPVHVLHCYQEQRRVGREVHGKLLKLVPTAAMRDAALKLGMLRNNVFVFDSELDMCVLQDVLNYTIRYGEQTLVQKYAVQSTPSWSVAERSLLQVSAKCRFCLVLIERLYPGLGVNFVDLLTGQQGFLIDVSISTTAVEGTLFASHITPVFGTDCWCTTGAIIPIRDDRVCQSVFQYSERLVEKFGSLRDLPADEQSELEVYVIQIGLKYLGDTVVQFAEPGDSPAGRIGSRQAAHSIEYVKQTASQRVGRNEPCPCGSGKKFKRCCSPTAN